VLEERNTETILSSIFETSVHLEDIAGLGYNIILHEFEDDGSVSTLGLRGLKYFQFRIGIFFSGQELLLKILYLLVNLNNHLSGPADLFESDVL